ncbi:MAG: flagellin lysine-N-methylase [Alphaproteobacteria bacterium]
MVNYSPQYVNKFSCLGSKCPETCCHGMMIDIDKETHSKYQKVKIEGIKNIPNLLQKKDNPTDKHFSSIKLKKDGHCSFLGNDGLCSIQKKYGENYLSHTCYTFPRKNINFKENKLVTLSVACPEAARLCLSNKNSMEIYEDKFYKKKSLIWCRRKLKLHLQILVT